VINFKDVQAKYKTEEKTIKVKAWDGEVKIKKLTIEETNTFLNIQKNDGGVAGIVQAVSSCLVEPEITANEINELDESAFEGVNEIYKALNEFSKPKK